MQQFTEAENVIVMLENVPNFMSYFGENFK